MRKGSLPFGGMMYLVGCLGLESPTVNGQSYDFVLSWICSSVKGIFFPPYVSSCSSGFARPSRQARERSLASVLEPVREDIGKDLDFAVGPDHPAVIRGHRDQKHLGGQFAAQQLTDLRHVELKNVVAFGLVVAIAELDPGVRVSFPYPLQGGLGLLARHERYANGPARPARRPLPRWTCFFRSRHRWVPPVAWPRPREVMTLE